MPVYYCYPTVRPSTGFAQVFLFANCLVKSNYFVFASIFYFLFFVIFVCTQNISAEVCISHFKNMTMRLVYELLIICFYTYNLVVIIRTQSGQMSAAHVKYIG